MTSFFSGVTNKASKFFNSGKTTDDPSQHRDQIPNYFTAKKTRVSVLDQDNAFVVFDAVMEDTHDGKATATHHPIEDSMSVSDHITHEPETLSLKAVVSNDLILTSNQDPQPAVAGGIGSTRNDRASAFNGGFNGSGGGTTGALGGFSFVGGRAEEAYEFLREVKNKGKLVSVYTTLHNYTSMYLASLSVSRDKDTGNMIMVNLTFQEIQIAVTQTTDAPTPISPARKPAQNLGKKVPETPTEPNQSRFRAAVTSIFGGGK